MNNKLVEKYKEKNPIGIYCLCNTMGIEIMDIDYSLDCDYVIIRCQDKIKKLKLYNNTKGNYFNWGKVRIYLYQCLRLITN